MSFARVSNTVGGTFGAGRLASVEVTGEVELGRRIDELAASSKRWPAALCGAGDSEPCSRYGSAKLSAIGNGVIDDTARFQSALNAGDVLVPPGKYLIHGSIIMPSYRTLRCEPGAVLESDNNKPAWSSILNFKGTRMSTVMGCDFQGIYKSGPVHPNYAIYLSGGGHNLVLGSTFTGFPSRGAISLTGGTKANFFLLNNFGINADLGVEMISSSDNIVAFNRLASGSVGALASSRGHSHSYEYVSWNYIADSLHGRTDSHRARTPFTNVHPGLKIDGHVVDGRGIVDDTAVLQMAVNAGDVVIAPGIYKVDGTIKLPAYRTVLCEPGATFYNPGDGTAGNKVFAIGYYAPSAGRDSIVGCKFKGTDVSHPPAYARSHEYTYGIEVGNNGHPNDILILGNTFEDIEGDEIITYSASTAADSGPSDVAIIGNVNRNCGFNGIHVNGGQNVQVAFNHEVDCTLQVEEDSQPQHINTFVNHNYLSVLYGNGDSNNGGPPTMVTCTGTGSYGNYRSAYCFNNVIDGYNVTTSAKAVLGWTHLSTGGNYTQNILINGASLY